MVLVVVTQEIEKETFLLNELNEIACHFTRVVVISTQKGIKIEHKYEMIISKNTDYLLSSIFYTITKFFSKETLQELRDRKKMRVKPRLKSVIYNWGLTWMIENRLTKYFSNIWNGEEIILYSYWLNTYAYFVANIKRKNPKITAIARAHSFEVRDFEAYIPFRKTIDRNLDKIIFISDYTQMEYESIMAGIKTQVRAEQRVIRLGVNNPTTLARRVTNKDRVLNIASCAGIYRLKRLDLIIDSLAKVPENVLLNWIHFGSGSDFEIIRDYAKKNLTKSNVTFKFRGQVDNEEIFTYYKNTQVDIFINTSDYEGVPVSIMEAMSFGIPCIARDVGGNKEIVKESISGRLLPNQVTSIEITEALLYFYYLRFDHPEEYLDLQKSTYDFWFSNFNASQNYSIFSEYILSSKPNG